MIQKNLMIFMLVFLASCVSKNVIKPIKGPITESIYAIGIVKSKRSYELKLGVITAVKKYFVSEGDVVKSGQALLIDDSGTLFKAPFVGVVTHLPFGQGETVAPQQTLVNLVDLKKLYMEASLEQLGALKIRSGQLVQISFESFRSQVFHGVVKNILPRNLEFVVQIDVKDLPENILPGMNADLSIEVMKKNEATLLPLAAVSNNHILLIRGKKSEKIPVIIGISDAEYVEILSPPLSLNDEVFLPEENKK
jgi:multidrug efflux pump subunit AcrA (membrane-fusion protein)